MNRMGVWLVGLVGAAAALLAAAGWVLGEMAIVPDRKPIGDNHLVWLSEPAAHGLRVKCGRTLGGVPFLVCEPEAGAGPGERGRILRSQLDEAGVELDAFGTIRGTLVLLHGRGGVKEDLLLTAERFCAVGIRCVIPDLPGHGANPNGPAAFGAGPGERAFARDVLVAAATVWDFPAEPAGLWGVSMGSAFALSAASEGDWTSVVLVSPLESLDAVISTQLASRVGPFWPVLRAGFCAGAGWRGVAVGRVRPVDWARSVEAPVLIIHGVVDELVPIGQGRRVLEALPDGRKRIVEVPTGGHGNVLVTPDRIYAEMAGWVLAGFLERAGR